jgi:hypothetical protein
MVRTLGSFRSDGRAKRHHLYWNWRRRQSRGSGRQGTVSSLRLKNENQHFNRGQESVTKNHHELFIGNARFHFSQQCKTSQYSGRISATVFTKNVSTVHSIHPCFYPRPVCLTAMPRPIGAPIIEPNPAVAAGAGVVRVS